MLFFNCWSEILPKNISIESTNISPYLNSSFLNRLLFSWCTDLIIQGFRNRVSFESLWNMSSPCDSESLTKKFEEHYFQLKESSLKNNNLRKGENHRNQSILSPLVKCLWKPFAVGAVMKLVGDILGLLAPRHGLLIRRTESYF